VPGAAPEAMAVAARNGTKTNTFLILND
jgi:hypothetical protein